METIPFRSLMQRLATAFVIMVGVLAYLGLAIAGWGGFASFFAHPARMALAIVSLALGGAAAFSSGNLSCGECEDRSNRWVIAVSGRARASRWVFASLYGSD
jgi:hypothetical protein